MQKYETPELELTPLMAQEKMAAPSDHLYEDEGEF